MTSTASYADTIIPGGNSWVDSYSVDGKCYCASTYDHGIGSFTVDTPAGRKTVVEVCEAIGPGPGRGSNPGYNTVQCGHDPGHSEEGTFTFTDGSRRRVADEIVCPGRVDIGPDGCDDIGPKWDLSVFGSSNETEIVGDVPGRIEAEDYTSESGTQSEDTTDTGGGSNVGFIQNGDYLSYDINVATSGAYKLDVRVSSRVSNSQIFVVPRTGGWQNWETLSTEINLDEGEQTLRLDFSGDNSYLLNVNWIEATQISSSTSSSNSDTLNRNNWSISSSHNENDVYSAVDGSRSSRWTTQQRQGNGQYFEIDFNQTESFDRIVLDSANSNNDQPRSYEVYVSNNGNNWGSAIATGSGDSGGITVINFDEQNARFVRIEQNGSDNRQWWSIHEIDIYSDAN